jgi:hypothetical protein
MTRQNGQVNIAIPSDDDVIDLTSLALYLLGYDEEDESTQ